MSTIEQPHQLYDHRIYDAQVVDHDGTPKVVSYTLRGLENDEDVAPWTLFCEQAFSYKKPTPPRKDYFARHYFNDPDRRPTLIRIAVASREDVNPTKGIQREDIVASCRIFHRVISLGGNANDSTEPIVSTLAVGGIGEVCTHESHRCRGLAKELLNDAIACMKALEMNVSLLHSAPSFFPVYRKIGYVNITSCWSVMTINHSALVSASLLSSAKDTSLTSISCVSLRLARFPSDTTQLKKLHHYYSEKRFVGCIVRSTEYWNSYISSEFGNSLWILEVSSSMSAVANVDNIEPKTILGWMALRYREQQQRYQLCEFGCNDIKDAPDIFQTMEGARCSVYSRINGTRSGCWTLHLPSPVLKEVRANLRLDETSYICDTVSENDDGWMYKPLSEKSVDVSSFADHREHLIWPSDSF